MVSSHLRQRNLCRHKDSMKTVMSRLSPTVNLVSVESRWFSVIDWPLQTNLKLHSSYYYKVFALPWQLPIWFCNSINFKRSVFFVMHRSHWKLLLYLLISIHTHTITLCKHAYEQIGKQIGIWALSTFGKREVYPPKFCILNFATICFTCTVIGFDSFYSATEIGMCNLLFMYCLFVFLVVYLVLVPCFNCKVFSYL